MKTMTKTMLMSVAAPLAMLATPAQAAVFNFDLSGAYTGFFTFDSDALADAEDFEDYFEVEATGTLDGRTGAQIVAFNAAAFDGGLTLGDSFTNLWGAQLFSGTTAAPVLRTGQFTLLIDGDAARSVTLNVAAVPEPASWAMMIAGFGLAGAAIRRRPATVATAV